MKSLWTSRDLDIVETLTRRVRLLSVDQIARIWWPSVKSLRVVRRRLAHLAEGQLVHRVIINAHPPLEMTLPLVIWHPGDDEPNFDVVSRQAQARWVEPAIPTEVFYSTKLAANLFGSSARELPPVNHRNHDLLLAQVYVLYRTTRPEEASLWIGEDTRPKAGYRIKDPDAFLVDDAGVETRVIESAGSYSAAQCESFHEHCALEGLAYELW